MPPLDAVHKCGCLLQKASYRRGVNWIIQGFRESLKGRLRRDGSSVIIDDNRLTRTIDIDHLNDGDPEQPLDEITDEQIIVRRE